MTYVIAEPCIGVKDRTCIDACPVDCIYEGEDQLYIHPDECIDCGACVPECPVTAIFTEEEVPAEWESYTAKNRDVFKGDNPPGRPKQ
jgi:ferredoxin